MLTALAKRVTRDQIKEDLERGPCESFSEFFERQMMQTAKRLGAVEIIQVEPKDPMYDGPTYHLIGADGTCLTSLKVDNQIAKKG